MTISKKNPLGILYHYWIYLGGQPRTPEDLCHFMRVIFLYLPFIYIFSVSVSVAFVMLVWFNPWSSVAVLAVLVSFGTFLAGILGTVYLCAEAESTEPIREWVKAKKHKYCPMVTFYEEENEKDQAETSQYQ